VRRPRCLNAVDGECLPVLSDRHHEGKSVLRALRGEIGRMLEVEKRSVGNSEKRHWPHRFLCGIPRCESYRDEANLRLTCRPKQPWPRPSPPLLQSKCASIPVRPHLAIPKHPSIFSHLNQSYCAPYDGIRIASGELGTHVCVWDLKTGSVSSPFLNPMNTRLRHSFIGPV
jgi:hypothetical protein